MEKPHLLYNEGLRIVRRAACGFRMIQCGLTGGDNGKGTGVPTSEHTDLIVSDSEWTPLHCTTSVTHPREDSAIPLVWNTDSLIALGSFCSEVLPRHREIEQCGTESPPSAGRKIPPADLDYTRPFTCHIDWF
ncbi:hypothetical protein Bbelb_140670 [Branchiostoma belcheri]|nr:hypothetical protein Bbelb_140670 [Branchiostoma belcheri]